VSSENEVLKASTYPAAGGATEFEDLGGRVLGHSDDVGCGVGDNMATDISCDLERR
jgi:hypothetical protein